MKLHFPVVEKTFDFLTNYELFMMPNGIYKAREIKASNYLYPMYFLKEEDGYRVSTSVYALIHYKKKFIRNPRFQTTHFYRPTFLTLDQEIKRVRTVFRRSSLELNNAEEIIKLGTKLIQEYVTEIEQKYPGWVHVVSMGGKDSQNIILAKRNEKWIVLSGEPNAPLNKKFIEDNKISLERFVSVSNATDNTFLLEEIMASDCMFDVAHFRWMRVLYDLVQEYQGRVIFWMGTSGDGTFKSNNNHGDRDYYAVHDLHVGMAMGVLHQVFKNFLNIPVVSPYQSPQFLEQLFYRFDPYFVDQVGDVRDRIGELLFGKSLKYPQDNPTPDPWKRNRSISIPLYVAQLKKEGIDCLENSISSYLYGTKERAFFFLDHHSRKRRGGLSRVLFPVRKKLAKVFPVFKNKRHDIALTEIK